MAGYWLKKLFESATGLNDSDTQRIELPNTGQLSAIQLRMFATRDSNAKDAATAAKLLEDQIDKIEVIAEGSEVIISVNPFELLALNYYDLGMPPRRIFSDVASTVNYTDFWILFGRDIGDTQYGLDLEKFRTVNLEVTHSLDTTAKLGFATGTLGYEVYLYRWYGDRLPFRGYFKKSQKLSYTAAGSGTVKDLDLPIGKPYRRILIRAYATGDRFDEGITHIELNLNNDEIIPIDMDTDDYKYQLYQIAGYFFQDYGRTFVVANTADVLTQTLVSDIREVALTDDTSGAATTGTLAYHGKDAEKIKLSETGGSNPCYVDWIVRGYEYAHTLIIPFNIPDEPGNYFNSTAYKNVRLKMTENSSSKTPAVTVVLEELVS